MKKSAFALEGMVLSYTALARRLAPGVALALATVLGSVGLAGAQAGGTLVGVVVSSNGVRVVGATVTLEGVGSTQTNAEGLFMFQGLSPGSFRMTVTAPGLPPDTRAIFIRAGQQNQVQVTLAGTLEPPPPKKAVQVRFERQGRAIYVPAVLNGRMQALMLIDTGATLCVITRGMAAAIGVYIGPSTPTMTIQSATGHARVPVVQVDSIGIAELEVRDVRAIVLDNPGGQEYGILGTNFLNQFQVSIDGDRGVLILRER